MNDDVNELRRAMVEALSSSRWSEALPLVDAWCRKFPEHGKSWLNKGYCLVQLGRFEEAAAAFERSLEIDPSSAKARGWRDRVMAELAGRWERGEASRHEPSAQRAPTEDLETASSAASFATMAIPESGRGWLEGTVVNGRYEVRSVARGGMAVVAIAFDRELRRMVAVKTPLPSVLATPDGRTRFQREAESWIALGLHPNICSAYYLQEIGGMPRLFVEYVDGGDLSDWLRQDESPAFEQQLDMAIQIARGLGYTHSFGWTDDEGSEHRGMIHRDIKPANVLVTSDGVARVTDFGLVRAESGPELDEPAPAASAAPPLPHTGRREDTFSSTSWRTVTIEGGLVGTPPYMAPELWARAHRGTVATDIYAYGCLLYELFCGRRPFILETDPASQTREENLGGWMRKHLREPVPDPAAMGLGLPTRLSALMRSCLAKKPADRPQSLDSVSEWLEEIFEEATGSPYPRPRPRQTQLLADSLNNRGVSYVTLELGDRAAASFKEALSVSPRHLEATFNQGLLEWRWPGLTEAELERRLGVASSGAVDRRRRDLLWGRLQLLLDNPNAAQESLQQAIGDAGSEAPLAVRRELGLAILARLRRAGDPGEAPRARDLLAGVAAESPSDLMTMVALAEACAETGDGNAAAEVLERAHALDDAVPLELAEAVATYLPGHVTDANRPLGAPIQSLLAIPPDDLAVRTVDGLVMIWSGLDPKPRRKFSVGGPARQGRAMAVVGDVLVVCLENGPLTLFDLRSGERLRNLRPHPGVATCVAGSESGETVATGGSDRCLRLWSLETGECLRTLHGHTAFVSAVAWLPSGQRLVTASADGTLRVWDLAVERCERVLEGHRGPVRALALAGGGELVVSAGQDGTVGVWELATGAHLRWLRGHHGAVQTVAVSGESVAAGGEDATVRLWDLDSGRAQKVMRLGGPVLDLVAEGDDRLWAAWGSTTQRLVMPSARAVRLPLALAEAESSRELAERERIFRGHLDGAVAAVGDGRMDEALLALREAREVVGYAHHTEAIAVWNEVLAFFPKGSARELVEIERFDVGPGAVAACALLEDRSILAASADGRLRLLGEHGDRSPVAADTELIEAVSIAVANDGRLAAVGGRSGGIALNEHGSGEGWHVRDGHVGAVAALAFAPDGMLVSAGEDRTVRLWSRDPEALPALIGTAEEPVLAIAVSDDGRFLASAGWDSEVTVWDLPGRAELRRMTGHGEAIHALAVSPDCRLIASADAGGEIRLWDLATGRCVRTLSGHEGAVSRILFTPDARFLVSAGRDATLRLWDARTGAESLLVEGHAGSITDLAMDASGGTLVSAGSDGSVRRWFVDWEPEHPEHGLWDDRVRPFLEVFLRRQELGSPGNEAPTWTRAELDGLLSDLRSRGFGWLEPERVERELQTMASFRDESRADEQQQAHQLAERRRRERQVAPARKVFESLTRNLGLKLAGAVVLVIVGLLAVASLRTPGDNDGSFNPALKSGVAALARERSERLRQGRALAYQEKSPGGDVECDGGASRQQLELVLLAEDRAGPTSDPGSPAEDAEFRTDYAEAVACLGRSSDSGTVEAILDRAAEQLHPFRLEDMLSILVRMGPPAEARLGQALDDHSETVRHLAALALLHSDRPSTVQSLVSVLDGTEMRRVEAASYVLTELVALGHVPESEAFPVVRQMCRSIDPRVRANAVRAVMLFEPTGPARELLDEVLEDPDPEVAAAAEQTRNIIRGAKVQELFGAG